MTRSSIRWVIAVPDPAGGLRLFRLAPIGAPLEFLAPDRQAAERMVVASGASLPDDSVLMSRLEFDDLQRSSPARYVLQPVRRLRRSRHNNPIGPVDLEAENSRLRAEAQRSRAIDVPPLGSRP